MPALTSPEEIELRSDSVFDYERRAYVYNDFTETVIWRGTITDATPARGQQSFTVSGTFETGFTNADIHRHCRVHVGTIQDYDNVSRRVVLSFNGTTTLVLDQAHDWIPANAQTVTIYNQYPLWNKLAYAKYDESAGTADFYQDGKPASEGGAGLVYNEIQQLRPHIRMGGNIVRRTSSFPISVDITPTIVMTNPDAVSNTPTVTVSPPGLATVTTPSAGVYRLTFSAAGKGTVHIDVVDNLGADTDAHRHIIIEDESTPISSVVTEFDYDRPPERVGQGNSKAPVTITAPDIVFGSSNGEIDWGTLRSDSLVMISQVDAWNGGEFFVTSRTGVFDISNNVILSGYSTSARETLLRSTGRISEVTLNVETLPDQFTYALSITGKTAPANFLEARPALMTVAGQLFVTLDGYSTLCTVQDVNLPWGDTALRAGNEVVTKGDIMRGARLLAKARLMDFTVGLDGRIAVLPRLNMLDSTGRNAAATITTLTEADMLEESSIDVIHRNAVALVTMNGGSSNGELGSSGQFSPILATSAETPSANAGTSQPDFPKQMFDDVADALQRVSRMSDILNQRNQQVTIAFPERYHHVFHVDNGEWFNLGSIFLATNKANIRGENDLLNIRAMVTGITYGDNSIVVTLQPEAPESGVPGVEQEQVSLPDPTNSNGFVGIYDDAATVTIPFAAGDPGDLLTIDLTSGPYDTSDSGNDWTARTTGMAATTGRYIVIDPTDSTTWIATGDGWVEKSNDSGATWTDVTPAITIPNIHSDSPAPTGTDLEYRIVQASEVTPGEYVLRAEWNPSGSDYRTWTLYSDDTCATYSIKGY